MRRVTWQLGDYNGRSLGTLNSSTTVFNPSDCPETEELRTWFDAAGGGSSFKSVSTRSGGGGNDGESGNGEGKEGVGVGRKRLQSELEMNRC